MSRSCGVPPTSYLVHRRCRLLTLKSHWLSGGDQPYHVALSDHGRKHNLPFCELLCLVHVSNFYLNWKLVGIANREWVLVALLWSRYFYNFYALSPRAERCPFFALWFHDVVFFFSRSLYIWSVCFVNILLFVSYGFPTFPIFLHIVGKSRQRHTYIYIYILYTYFSPVVLQSFYVYIHVTVEVTALSLLRVFTLCECVSVHMCFLTVGASWPSCAIIFCTPFPRAWPPPMLKI